MKTRKGIRGVRIRLYENGYGGTDVYVNGHYVSSNVHRQIQTASIKLAQMKLAQLVRRDKGVGRFVRLRAAVAKHWSCVPYLLVRRVGNILLGKN